MDTIENKLEALVNRIRAVRWWLVAMEVLKVTAITVGFMAIYIFIYALLDHYLHIGVPGRLTAFFLFLAGMVWMTILLVRNLYGHVSCSKAANFVESRLNFDQQLVAIIEYHENQSNYPYSKILANHLIGQVDQAASKVDFMAAVPKAKIGALALAVILGGILAGSYLHNHYVFFSRYFSRLVHPLAVVNPLPATTLKPLSGNLIAEPEQIITPAAQITGRVPQTADLILESIVSQGTTLPAEETFPKTISITPVKNETGQARLETEVMLPEGKYRYRFQAADATSPWQTIVVARLPKITNLTAEVSFPDNKKLQPYTQKIKDNKLEVLKGAHVKLTAQTNMPVQALNLFDRDKSKIPTVLTANDTAQAQFNIQREQALSFQIATNQITTDVLPQLQIKLKKNQPADIKLICPEGDYSATNVASVPITFQASDDLGLNSATIYCEIAGGKLIASPASFTKGSQKVTFETMLELEEYDLNVGDSIIFYAKAEDLNIEDNLKPGTTSTSEIYFIEIMPYRRLWFSPTPGLPNQPKQGLKASSHDKLTDVLEYTRAFIKKTWAISQKKEISSQDQIRMNSIAGDIEYAGEQLTLIRNDPRYQFDDIDKAKLDEILSHYNQAIDQLKTHIPVAALTSEKQAYQALRKFIIDLVRVIPPNGGTSPPPSGPERVKMDDQMHVTRYEKEQIEWELKLLNDKLEALRSKEEELKKNFDHFLRKLADNAKSDTKVNGEQKWTDANQKNPGKPCPPADSNPNEEQNTKLSMEGAIPPSLQQQAKGGEQKQNSGESGNNATLQEQMSLLQARQKDIEKQIENIKQTMEQLPTADSNKKPGDPDPAVARNLTRKHLDKAADQMKDFQKKVNESNYQDEKERAQSLEKASNALANALQELAKASETLKSQLTLGEQEQVAQTAGEIAKYFDRMAREYDESVSPEERQEMLNSLERARKLLEQAQPTKVVDVNAPAQTGESPSSHMEGAPNQTILNPLYDNSLPPPEKSKLLALKFWSISIEAQKRQSQLTEEDPSDAEFHLMEKRFFEAAAKFNEAKEKK